MASLLDKFVKNVVGARGRIADYLPVISSSGDFKRVIDLEVILSSWNNILLTPLRTYLYNPDYGSNLYKYTFEPQDETTMETIRNEILTKLTTYDDRARITRIDVQFMNNYHGFVVDIEFIFEGERGKIGITVDGQKYLNIL